MTVPLQKLSRDALGLGLRPAFYAHWDQCTGVDYVEAISENFIGPALPPRQNLKRVLRRHPLVLHGVGLNILGQEDLDPLYLQRLVQLAQEVDAPFVSDHLCWTGAHGFRHHDLLPMPYTHDLVEFAAARAASVQKMLQRPFALENLSSYVTFPESEMSEWEFYTAVVQEADVHFMLDINNIYVSSQNHGFDPYTYLQAINYDRVVQVHLAGHERQADGSILDTHDRPVADAVWELYRHAWKIGGPFPTLLEWDDRIPPLPEVVKELAKAREMRA